MEQPDDINDIEQFRRHLWQFIGNLAHPDAPGNAYEMLREHAYAGNIAWDFVPDTREAADGLRTLLLDMATHLTTCAQLAGLLKSIDGASSHGSAGHMSVVFKGSTGAAGNALLARARGRRGSHPLPAGWADVCRNTPLTIGSSAAFFATRMLRAGHEPGSPSLTF